MSDKSHSKAPVLSRRGLMGVTAVAATLAAVGAQPQPANAEAPAEDITKLPRVKQTLVAPPFLPEHDQVAVGGPKIVEVTMMIEEKKLVIDDEGT